MCEISFAPVFFLAFEKKSGFISGVFPVHILNDEGGEFLIFSGT